MVRREYPILTGSVHLFDPPLVDNEKLFESFTRLKPFSRSGAIKKTD